MKRIVITIIAIAAIAAIGFGIRYLWWQNQQQKELGDEMTEIVADFSVNHPSWSTLPDRFFSQELKIGTGHDFNQEITFLVTWRAIIETDSTGNHGGVDTYRIKCFKAKRTDSNSNVKLYKIYYSSSETGIRANDLTRSYDDALISFITFSQGDKIQYHFTINGVGNIFYQPPF